MPKTFKQSEVLKFYREFEVLKKLQAQVNEDLKLFREDCKIQEMPFQVFQRVYAAEQKKDSSCSTVKREVARELDTVKVLEEALLESDDT
tara:strand:+ start:230 stop:499 length:270 start_codon:yes stop_codon:yes gene_type:complete